MLEVVAAANADLVSRNGAGYVDADEIVGRMFALTETMGDYRTSMVIDYVSGLPLEVEAILGAPARRAAELGVRVPTIDALYTLVQAADLRRAGAITTLTPGTL